MPIKIISYANLKGGDHFMTVQRLGSGWAAVEMWINNEHEVIRGTNIVMEDFPEPWNTGIGRYATKEEAKVEAQSWAESEEIPMLEERI